MCDAPARYTVRVVSIPIDPANGTARVHIPGADLCPLDTTGGRLPSGIIVAGAVAQTSAPIVSSRAPNAVEILPQGTNEAAISIPFGAADSAQGIPAGRAWSCYLEIERGQTITLRLAAPNVTDPGGAPQGGELAVYLWVIPGPQPC